MQLTWSPSSESLVAIRPFVCEKKRFAQKLTDDGRLTIVLAHSWNELKMQSSERGKREQFSGS